MTIDLGIASIPELDDIDEQLKRIGGSANRIMRVTEYSCGNKWWPMVDLAKPAAGSVVLMLVAVQWDEVLEEYANPAKARRDERQRKRKGKDRKRGGKRKRIKFPGIPNTNAVVAGILPGVKEVQGRNAGKAQRFVFGAIDILDRVLWQWIILSAIDTFTYEWSSGLIESGFCRADADTFIGVEGRRELTNISPVPAWDFPEDPDEVETKLWLIEENGTLKSFATFNQDGRIFFTAQVFATNQTENPLSFGFGVEVDALREGTVVGNSFSETVTKEVQPGQTVFSQAAADLEGDRIDEVRVRITNTAFFGFFSGNVNYTLFFIGNDSP